MILTVIMRIDLLHESNKHNLTFDGGFGHRVYIDLQCQICWYLMHICRKCFVLDLLPFRNCVLMTSYI